MIQVAAAGCPAPMRIVKLSADAGMAVSAVEAARAASAANDEGMRVILGS